VNVSPELAFCGLIGGSRQIAHSFGGFLFALDGAQRPAPQSVSGKPQSAGYANQENRGERGNGPVVFASSDAGAGRMQFESDDRFDEQGAFFVKGVIGMVVLALVYAILKRF
jgi:hypothetical protein